MTTETEKNLYRGTENFRLYYQYDGLILDDGEGTKIYGFQREERGSVEIPKGGGLFGYVAKGHIALDYEKVVKAGEWFSFRDGVSIWHSAGAVFAVWQKADFNGYYSQGEVEADGRLKYIDGAKDSVLINPIKFGDPCLNALYMPTGINQTAHTHPSTRSGFIIAGGATCQTEGYDLELETFEIFYLKTDTVHKFRTDFEAGRIMKLVAYHPDSDFGAKDEEHPMLSRTIIDGISAKEMPDVWTK